MITNLKYTNNFQYITNQTLTIEQADYLSTMQ